MENNQDPWRWGNEILYRMCREEPLHVDDEIIIGKVWIIGRAYSATIERKAGENIVEGENFYARKVAPAIRNSNIDAWLKSVNDINRITLDNFHRSLEVHKKFTALLKEITGIAKRSLASKYLHFHAPNAFFIFDSIANTELRNRLNRKRFDFPKTYDDEYASYVVRCLHYRDKIFEKNLNHKISPRELDQCLLGS